MAVVVFPSGHCIDPGGVNAMTGRGDWAGIASPGCRSAVGVALPRAGGELPLRGDIVGLVANCPLRGDIVGLVASCPFRATSSGWWRTAPFGATSSGWWRAAPSGRHRRAGGELPPSGRHRRAGDELPLRGDIVITDPFGAPFNLSIRIHHRTICRIPLISAYTLLEK